MIIRISVKLDNDQLTDVITTPLNYDIAPKK